MILSKLSKYWSRGLWKLFRPSELISGLVDGFRVAFNPTACISDLGEPATSLPVSVGASYKVLTVKLSNIRKDSDAYILTGAPSGIICFCRSLTKVGACLYYDFTETAQGYRFTVDPAVFGTLSTDGSNTCSFIVFNAAHRSLGLQDTSNHYLGSSDHFVNQAIRQYDTEAQICNGIDHRLIKAAAGIKTENSADPAVRKWIEGGKLFAVTASGELLRDYTKAETSDSGEQTPSMYLVNDMLHYYPDTSNIPNTLNNLTPVLSIDTTMGPSDLGAHRAIRARINPVSTLVLFQRIALDTLPTNATGLYVFYSNSASADDPLITPGMDPRQAIYDNTSAFGAVRIAFGEYPAAAISVNGRAYGSPLSCGKYLKGVAYIIAGNSLAADAILSYISVPSTPIYAGECVVFTFNNPA